MFRFSIRDVLWLTVVVAIAAGQADADEKDSAADLANFRERGCW
jgi:tellurite resistance protein